jgi:hypothetical protein
VREEMTALKTALGERERALAGANANFEQARQRWTEDAQAALRMAKEAWKTEEAQRLLVAREEWEKKDARTATTKDAVALGLQRDRRARAARKLLWGGAVATAVVFAATNYARIEAVARNDVPKMLALVSPAQTPRDAPASPGVVASPAPARTAEKRSFIGVPIANIRARPSSTAAIVTTLSRDAEVTPVEWHGSWVLIRITRDGDQTQEGWIYGSFLKDAAGS